MRSLVQIFLTVAAFLVAAAVIHKAEAAAGQGIHENNFNPLCAVLDEPKKSEGYTKHLILELDAAASVALKQALKLRIYAETIPAAAQRINMRNLSDAYQDYSIAEFSAGFRNCQTVVHYKAAANYMAGGVDTVIDLLFGAEAAQAGSGTCTRTGSTASSTPKTKSQLKTACTARYNSDRQHDPAKKPAVTNLRLTAGCRTTLTTRNNETCALTCDNTDCLFHLSHVHTGAIEFLGGLIGFKKDGLATKAFDPATAEETIHLALFAEKTALQILNGLEGKAGAAAGNKSTEQIEALSTLANHAAASQGKNDKEGAELKTQEFGDTGDKINKALWNVVEKLEVAKEALPEAPDIKLGSINSFKELTRVMGYYEALKEQQFKKFKSS
uniref:Variant surface glycoprotein 1125.1371 n=1 Tax=Trypanosoma brucei TaxID=5691 RepID=A0A1J0R746_9TRYP|nr:variant surface glycoprotein 1125.1371 [Trypanosoma brucei]